MHARSVVLTAAVLLGMGACARPTDTSPTDPPSVTTPATLAPSAGLAVTTVAATTGSGLTTIAPTIAPTTPALTTDPPTTAPSTTTVVIATTTATTSSTTSSTTTHAPAPSVVIARGTSGRHEVALTFDAGADVGNAAHILDVLAAEGIRASFGMTGSWAEDNPTLVERMVDEGHVLINHTMSHPYMTELSTADRLTQLADADAVVSDIAGRSMQPYFRPPYGDVNASVLADVGGAGYRYTVTWTIDSLGWKGLAPTEVTQRCLDGAADGAIFLLHVGSQSTDDAALADIIAGLRASGYAFVTVTELLA